MHGGLFFASNFSHSQFGIEQIWIRDVHRALAGTIPGQYVDRVIGIPTPNRIGNQNLDLFRNRVPSHTHTHTLMGGIMTANGQPRSECTHPSRDVLDLLFSSSHIPISTVYRRKQEGGLKNPPRSDRLSTHDHDRDAATLLCTISMLQVLMSCATAAYQ